jgi:hypothetical protein
MDDARRVADELEQLLREFPRLSPDVRERVKTARGALEDLEAMEWPEERVLSLALDRFVQLEEDGR